MAIIDKNNTQRPLTEENIIPASKLARYLIKLAETPYWSGLTVAEKTSLLAYDEVTKKVSVSLESYQAAMAIWIEKEVLSAEWFSHDSLLGFKRARLNHFARTHEIPANIVPQKPEKTHEQVIFYQQYLYDICRCLGVPAQPPEFPELAVWVRSQSSNLPAKLA